MEDIILIGMGGHAKGIVDTIEKNNQYHIVGFVDKEEKKCEVYRGYKIIGDDSDLKEIFEKGVRNAFLCIGFLGDSDGRAKLYGRLKEIGYDIPVIIDNTAAVAEDAIIEEGTYVGKNAVINADAYVGKMCIVNTGAIIEHDCKIMDFTHVAVGAVVCGMCQIGEKSLIGANSTVIQGLRVGEKVKIGAGSVVLSDVEDETTVYGVWNCHN